MSFTKNDLEAIKSKIQLSTEIEKKVKVIKKGNDYWCCCPFHEEKTPSCKINDNLGSYYCFGCGAKGDIFTIYTDLYNYSFPDAVKELANKVGIRIIEKNIKQNEEYENIFKILEVSTKWFENNLFYNDQCKNYLNKRSISMDTIKKFRIGFSYNAKSSLYDHLKNNNFSDKDILKSNVIKIDNNKKIKDFFYKRLIFPISNEKNTVIGFGGRVLDNSNPKYINSPESNFFQKRSILYNLNNAKEYIRTKKNILICEGYMDVISLYENNIKTVVAPLGTALTENQLLLSWKYAEKPTIMFDGDEAGLRASYKSALMSLQYISPNKYLQFIKLPKNYDPDSLINKSSLKHLIELLKKPIPIVKFIFDQSSSSVDLSKAEDKISFDKYIDDIIDTIKDKKIKFFYKNEFKNLFFNKLKSRNKKTLIVKNKEIKDNLLSKQINSFMVSYLNHIDLRDDLAELLLSSNLLDDDQVEFINYFQKNQIKEMQIDEIKINEIPKNYIKILKYVSENSILDLFPYCKKDNDSRETLLEIQDSVKNLNTRLSNLKKINKSLDKLDNNFSSLSWDELKKIKADLISTEE